LGSGYPWILVPMAMIACATNTQAGVASCSTTSTTTAVTLWVECDRVLGLLHSSYLIQIGEVGLTIESMRHHALEPESSSSAA
jgi:hypothetical protein